MSGYENYYNVTLLDDLHNYFPEVLYGSQFDNDTLVSYIRSQARSRFDLFTNGMNRHNGSLRPNVTTTVPRDTVRVTYTMNEDIDESQEDSLLNPLTTFLTAALYPQTSSMLFPQLRRQTNSTFMEPVVVRPTQQQINSGSSIVELTNNSDNSAEICSICQDSLVQDGRQVRRINTCHHMFHDNCINTWFNNNVRCPTCRHDIRTQNTS